MVPSISHYQLEYKKKKKKLTFRKIKDIDIVKFQEDIINSSLYESPKDDPDQLLEQYNSTLKNILDKHAPESTKIINIRNHAPWFNNNVKEAIRSRRRAERKWRKSKLQIHLEIYKDAQKTVKKVINSEKSQYLLGKIENSNGDQKMLYQVTSELLKSKQSSRLPTHNDDTVLANEFSDYFHNKIKIIYDSFPKDAPYVEDRTSDIKIRMENLSPVTLNELKKLILSMKSKSCSLDPILTTVKEMSGHTSSSACQIS